MSRQPRVGRPRVSSQETLAEAACELFLEKGYDATSVADITRRAGVSRSSFFNYFSSKSDVLWAGLDERIAQFEVRLAEGEDAGEALRAIADDLAPDALALALTHSGAMSVAGELARESAVRAARIGQALADRLTREGVEALTAQVRGGAAGAALLAAIHAWAQSTPGAQPLREVVDRALALLG